MKSYKILAVIAIALFVSSAVFAKHHLPEERGKALFNDKNLGGGISGMSCGSCHPEGKGLEGIGNKKEWNTPGGSHKSLEEAVNICITMALKGKPLDVNSKEMKDIVAYMKSIKAKTGEAPKKKAAGY